MSIEDEVDGAAREAMFRLEVVLLAEDYRDDSVTPGTLTNHIRRVAGLYKLPPWLIRRFAETHEDAANDRQGIGRRRMTGTVR